MKKESLSKTVPFSTKKLLEELDRSLLEVKVTHIGDLYLVSLKDSETLEIYSTADEQVSNGRTDTYHTKPMAAIFLASITDGKTTLKESRLVVMFRTPKENDFRKFFQNWDGESDVINYKKYTLIKVERLNKSTPPRYAVEIPGTDSEDGKTALYQTVHIPVCKYFPVPECVCTKLVLKDSHGHPYKRLQKELDFAKEYVEVIEQMLEELISYELKNGEVKLKKRACSYLKTLEAANKLDITLKTPETDSEILEDVSVKDR